MSIINDLVQSNSKFSPLLKITNSPGAKKKEQKFDINIDPEDIPSLVG